MILEDATYEAFGYEVWELPPQSAKPIFAACNACGKVRETSKRDYRPLCRSCAKKGEKNYFFNKTHTDETKALMSANLPDHIGANNPNWKDGASFEPYCVKFNNEYKDYIRNLFGNECFLCGLSADENGQALSVHHPNYNKDCGCDGTVCICVPLCKRCHAKTNGDRDYWQALIMEMLKPFVAWERCVTRSDK